MVSSPLKMSGEVDDATMCAIELGRWLCCEYNGCCLAGS
jgi:hypothetical protein